jgi:hypothetical protein
MKIYEFGDIVHKQNGQPCRVLNDPGGDDIYVAVILSGWGDPHSWIKRSEIKEAIINAVLR